MYTPQLLFTDFVDVEHQQKYSASADQWVSYKASQKALLDGVKNVRNVIVYTGDIHNRLAVHTILKHTDHMLQCLCVLVYYKLCVPQPQITAMHSTDNNHNVLSLLLLSLLCTTLHSYVFEAFSNPSNGGLPYFVEFVGTSVTSGNRADGLRANGANAEDIEAARQVLLQNPSMIDADIDCHGYFITRYSKGYMLADYYCANNIKSATDTSERSTWHYKVCDGKSKAIKASESC
jgi:hypothetical protein